MNTDVKSHIFMQIVLDGSEKAGHIVSDDYVARIKCRRFTFLQTTDALKCTCVIVTFLHLHDLTFVSAGRGEAADLQRDERAPQTAIKLQAWNQWIFLTLGQFPAMFMATKSGILSQNRILSLTLTKWCNPKLNQAIITPLLKQWKWKRKILPKETYSCTISVVYNDGHSIYSLTIGFLSFFVICFSSRSDHECHVSYELKKQNAKRLRLFLELAFLLLDAYSSWYVYVEFIDWLEYSYRRICSRLLHLAKRHTNHAPRNTSTARFWFFVRLI